MKFDSNEIVSCLSTRGGKDPNWIPIPYGFALPVPSLLPRHSGCSSCSS